MNGKPKLSLAVFVSAIAFTVLITGWAAVETYRTLNALRMTQRFSVSNELQADIELADRLRAAVTGMNQNLQRAVLAGDSSAAIQFQHQREAFETWLHFVKNRRRQVRELDMRSVPFATGSAQAVNEIAAEFAPYAAAADEILRADPASLSLPARLTQLEQTERHRQRLLSIAVEVRARADALKLSSATGIAALRRQVWLFVGLLALGVLCGLIAAYARWRELAPLRRTLRSHEAALEKQQKLANFGELAAGLVHEIRNPLTAINARLFTLELSLPANAPERNDAAVIRREIERLDRVVNDFLKLARPAPPAFVSMTASLALNELAHLLAPTLAQRNIQLILAETVPDRFRADPAQLKQVLINLVQNAADSCAAGGQIVLRARRDSAKLDGALRQVVALEVQDNGSGIPAEMRDRLFDPFFSTKDGGTGLGLAISARIIDKHHGAIECKSEVGRGTTFEVMLPVEETASQ
jgi:signal transduction histidine kinase